MPHLSWAEFYAWLSGTGSAYPAEGDIAEAANYNVPPTSMLPVLRQEGADLHGGPARWGFIPHWHKKALKDWKATTINARIESVTTAPSFRDAYKHNRCVVLASGYFEWQVRDGVKHPYYIHPANNAPVLLFAGLYSTVSLPDYTGMTCTILTEAARGALVTVHDRMPVMLDRDGLQSWLGGTSIDALVRVDESAYRWHEVGKAVGKVQNNGPQLIEALD